MKYIFFLGKTPLLSLAEINAMLKKYQLSYQVNTITPQYVIIDVSIDNNFDIHNFFIQMGGTIKIAELLNTAPFTVKDLNTCLHQIINDFTQQSKGKKNLAYSLYHTNTQQADTALTQIKKIFYNLKKQLPDAKLRIIEPKTGKFELSSASIINNQLTNPRKGLELNFIILQKQVIISRTIINQDINSYADRDYNKPGKNMKIGMMPPKLAQIMINLAILQPGQTIFDPFCGTGTILQEALLNDYRVIGSDTNDQQIQNCKINLQWLAEKYILSYPKYKIYQAGFAESLRNTPRNTVNAIITESTLGPAYSKLPTPQEITENHQQLKKLYLRFLESAKNILPLNGKIILTLPAYQKATDSFIFCNFIDSWEKIGYSTVYPIDSQFKNPYFSVNARKTMIYSRPDQIVAREIIILSKNK